MSVHIIVFYLFLSFKKIAKHRKHFVLLMIVYNELKWINIKYIFRKYVSGAV